MVRRGRHRVPRVSLTSTATSRDVVRQFLAESAFEFEAHHFRRRWVLEEDDRRPVAALLERLHERVPFLQEEHVVPLGEYRSNISFVHDPPFLGEFADDGHLDFVIVAVRAATFPVVVHQTMSRADANRAVTSDVKRPFRR